MYVQKGRHNECDMSTAIACPWQTQTQISLCTTFSMDKCSSL